MAEKVEIGHQELVASPSKIEVESEMEIAEALRNYIPGTEAEKQLIRKIDIRLMPILFVMYFFNYVDRTNIGNAKIAGMAKDLKLTDGRYSLALSLFFIGYLLMEVPSNMILSRSKPSWYLPGIMLVWGSLAAAMGAVPNFGGLVAFRFTLGCIESGFFPGVLFLLSCWYKPAEIGKRVAVFYTAAVLSGAFGGLLAGAITGNLHNARGIAGWRWLFIIEGVSTVAVAIVAVFILLDFPSTSKMLNAEERQLAIVRILHSGLESGSADPANRLTHWQAFKAACADYRTWLFMLLLVLDIGAGTISYFIPTITKSLGYSTTVAQYMTIPVYIVAAIVLNCVAFSADRLQERRWHVTAALTLGCVAGIVCATVEKPSVRYAMLCFVAAGIWTALPLILAWTTSTINLPAEKRAITIAMVGAVGNLSSVYGAYLWPSTTAPQFTLGWTVTTAFLGSAAVLAAIIPVICKTFPHKVTEAERLLAERKEARGIGANEVNIKRIIGEA